jgi:hypothetical protein
MMTTENTLSLPVFSEQINGVDCVIDPANWTDEQKQSMLNGAYEQGLRIILQRSTAGKSNTAKAIADKAKALQAGNYSFGAGGGGGPRQDATTKAWIDYCNSLGLKEDKKAVNGSTLERAQKTLCRRALIAEHDPGTDERKDVEANIGKHLDERFDAWKESEEENNPVLKMGIEYQKMLAAQKKMA